MQILEVNGLRKVYTTRFGGASGRGAQKYQFQRGKRGIRRHHGRVRLRQDDAAQHSGRRLTSPPPASVLLDGKDLASRSGKPTAAAFRRDHLGFVFQEFNLLDTFSVEDNIYLPLVLAGMPLERDSPQRLEPIAANGSALRSC